MAYTSPPVSTLENYVTLTQAVELGYGAYQTLRKYIANGTLPAVKLLGRTKVLRSDLDALAVPIVPDEPGKHPEVFSSAVEQIVEHWPLLSEKQKDAIAEACGH